MSNLAGVRPGALKRERLGPEQPAPSETQPPKRSAGKVIKVKRNNRTNRGCSYKHQPAFSLDDRCKHIAEWVQTVMVLPAMSAANLPSTSGHELMDWCTTQLQHKQEAEAPRPKVKHKAAKEEPKEDHSALPDATRKPAGESQHNPFMQRTAPVASNPPPKVVLDLDTLHFNSLASASQSLELGAADMADGCLPGHGSFGAQSLAALGATLSVPLDLACSLSGNDAVTDTKGPGLLSAGSGDVVVMTQRLRQKDEQLLQLRQEVEALKTALRMAHAQTATAHSLTVENRKLKGANTQLQQARDDLQRTNDELSLKLDTTCVELAHKSKLVHDLQEQLAANTFKQACADSATQTSPRHRANRDADALNTGTDDSGSKCLELRLGFPPPPTSLIDVQLWQMQGKVADRKWKEFSEASSRFPGVEAIESRSFGQLAHACQKGLYGVVCSLISAANQHQHGMSQGRHGAADIRHARSRVKSAQGYISIIQSACARLLAFLQQQEHNGTTTQDATYAQRLCFARGCRLMCERMHILAEIQHLALERGSVDQTIKHAQTKQQELTQLKDSLKQPSPPSETSCLDALPHTSPAQAGHMSTKAVHSSATNGSSHPSVQSSVELADQFQNACARLMQTCMSIKHVTEAAPGMRERLAEFSTFCNTLPQPGLQQKGKALCWAIMAASAEFGCDVRSNVGTLSTACENLAAVL